MQSYFRLFNTLLLLEAFVFNFMQLAKSEEMSKSESAKILKQETKLKQKKVAGDLIYANNELAIEAYEKGEYLKSLNLLGPVVTELSKDKLALVSYSDALKNLALVLRKNDKTKVADGVLAQSEQIRKNFQLPKLTPKFVSLAPDAPGRHLIDKMFLDVRSILEAKDPFYPAEKIKKYNSEKSWSELFQQGEELKSKGNYKQANSCLRMAVAAANKFPQPNENLVAALNGLAELYKNSGRAQAALMLYEKAMRVESKLGSLQTPAYATLLDNAAQAYQILGDYQRAAKIQGNALEIYKKTLGFENLDTAIAMSNLADTYKELGQFTKAESLLDESLDIMHRIKGINSAEVLVTMDNLGILYRTQGNLAKAESIERQVVDGLEHLFPGKDHHDLAIAYGNLAKTLASRKKFIEAEEMSKRCIAINKKVFGDKHPHYLKAKKNYVQILYEEGKKKEAKEIENEISSLRI